MAEKGQCQKCTGLCCRYFALPIEKPKTREDYDDIRWYLCHKDISIFVEKGDWYLSVNSKCRHLSEKNYECDIYDRRPRICRKYKHENCDAVQGEYRYALHFTGDWEMDEYIRVKFDNNVAKKRKMVKTARKSKA